MAVISVAIEASVAEIINGIPQSVVITTNVPATIFYTLDGTDPTLFSNVYLDTLFLPYDGILNLTLKVFASNGMDSSPIITEIYVANILNDTRMMHSSTDGYAQPDLTNLYPFGTPPLDPTPEYLNPGDAGTTVFNPDLPATATGYDGSDNPTGFTNKPFDLQNYKVVYSTSDAEGQTGHGIGSLPAEVTVQVPTNPAETTNQFDQTFDPRALVIFQDFSKEMPGDPAIINRQFSSFENDERSRDGVDFYNTALDTRSPSATFVRSFFNPRDNTVTSYYFDSLACRWLISKAPYVQNGTYDGNLSNIVRSFGNGIGFVFEWIPFQRRALF